MRAPLLAAVLAFSFANSAYASAWVNEPGDVRAAVTMTRLSSRGQFAAGDADGLTGPLCVDPVSAGDRMPYSCVSGGRFAVTQLMVDASVGVLPWLTLDLAVPVVLDALFEDDVGRTNASGLDDLTFGLRAGRTWSSWAVAGALHVKAPTGPRNFQDRDVAIGEGQWDLESGIRLGRSLWPYGWAEIHQALRVRLGNPETGIDPGEEWVGAVGLGLTPVQQVGVQGRAEWILATADATDFGTRSPGRRLLQLRAGVFARPTEPLWVEVGVAVPLAGQRWPTGPTWTASVAWRFETSE
jgi:hypothetical protein